MSWDAVSKQEFLAVKLSKNREYFTALAAPDRRIIEEELVYCSNDWKG